MRRFLTTMGMGAWGLGMASAVGAQMGQIGANLFQRPAIAKLVNPVVGTSRQI